MLNGEKLIERPLRWGMVGGGRTGQVGYKHRLGALRDNTAYRLVCGAFDIDSERGRDFGEKIGVETGRCYADYRSMIAQEAGRADGVEVVTVATPNHTHYEITKACLEAGLHVICEKPLFFTVRECEEIERLADARGLIVGVTYGYSAYPMLLQMRAMVAQGMIGDVRMVDLTYVHGFNSGDDTNATEAQKWRTNPATSGPTFVLGDISTHTYYMSQVILPDMKIEKLLCDRQSFIRSRAPLEDNAYVLFHYNNGAVGRLWCSSVCAGSMEAQTIRIIGSKASLIWRETMPNELVYEIQGQPGQVMHHGMPYLDQISLESDRLGALHTEGLSESWANIYLRIAQAIDAKNRRDDAALDKLIYPGIKGGTDGVRWLEACVRSAEAGAQWVDFA
ncbi:Gfo/Idh/MocA family protein [Acidocella sp.]|uniref:Gfo/Idh/MocA family protein n=1 Tax=Acidocella sp. TaxID=50710 RepID=UPI00262B66CF|nr:Gfo/Idh/MocA family oxidoreductase [Acidocella sp.]